MEFSHITPKQNVYYLTPEDPHFSKYYLAVREKEKRVLTDAQVMKLPDLKLYEWQLRKKSTQRFVNYINTKHGPLHILDIGCGNGWFSNKIAETSNVNQVIGLDINRVELEQAASVFNRKNLKFVYVDLFKNSSSFESQFNIITLNGTIQYFDNFKGLMALLRSFLKPEGEIHIIDSPFYQALELPKAKHRTKKYYTDIGVPEMASQYHHHDIALVKDFESLYKNQRNLIYKILRKKDSPFSWYRFIKKEE